MFQLRIPFVRLIVLSLILAGSLRAQVVRQTIELPQWPELGTIDFESLFYSYQGAIDRDLTGGAQAYDYSMHVIKDGPLYRLYSGGRWLDATKTPRWEGDHVMQYVSETGLGDSWTPAQNRPEFLQGQEEGAVGTWYSNNTLEPEVIKVGGTYYMYSQLQINPVDPIDEPGVTAVGSADRIQLHTSPDGLNWTRYSTTHGVVYDIPDPGNVALHHQEVIYVPWDDKPWWMYVATNVGGVFKGYFRIRSTDPTHYDYTQRQQAGLAQLGNQIGYIREAPGGPLFVRITFTSDGTGRKVPTLQFSRDGLTWPQAVPPLLLAGSRDNKHNSNCYFLGMSTIDGQGQLEPDGPNRWKAIYAASTCKTSVAPEIFFAEGGCGVLTLQLTPPQSAVGSANWQSRE